MFCIIAFIVFLLLYPILGIFSADYRYLFRKSFSCVFKKITFKPCDIDLKTEIKGRFLGKIIFKYPSFAKFFDRSFDIVAFFFVVLSIWSLLYTALAGLNLYVYDTCNPDTGESCSLSGDACGVSSVLRFSTAVEEGRIVEWAAQPFTTLSETVSRIPNRNKNWIPSEYKASNATYKHPYDESKPDALEIIDPGCEFCKQLYSNIRESGFDERYNLTYLVYPIPDETTSTGYKFQHSYLIATYLESVKDYPLDGKDISADWFILDAIFTRNGEITPQLQTDFNFIYTEQEAVTTLHDLLKEYGYTEEQITQIAENAQSENISTRLDNQVNVVENEVQTIRIPTMMFDGRRFDRVVDVETLRE